MAMPIGRRRLVKLLGAAGAVTSLAACGGGPPPPTETRKEAAPASQPTSPGPTTAPAAATTAPAAASAKPAASGATADGPVLKAGTKADTSSLDGCCMGGFAGRQFGVNIYSSLFRTGDGTEPVADIAESWEASSDLMSWKFRLKKGVLFQNGRELVADDVRACVKRIQDPNTKSGVASEYRTVEDVIAEDKYTVVFKMSKPHATVREQLVPEWGGLYPVELVGKRDLVNEPLGAGAFQFVEKVPKVRTAMARYPKYHVQGVPKLGQVIYMPIPDEAAKVAALKAGDVDWIDSVPFQSVASFKSDPNYTYMEKKSTWIEYVLLRVDRKPFDDVRVRQAVVHALDRPAISQAITLGLYQPAYSDVPDFSPVPLQFEPLKHDPDRARKLLAEAGYKDGFETAISAPSYDPLFTRIATVMADQWGKVGIKATVRPYDSTISDDWMVAVDGNTQGYDPDTKLYRNYTATGGFRYPLWKYRNARVEELVEKGRQSLDVKERSKIYSEALQIITDEAPRFTIWHRTHNVAMKKSVQNYTVRHDSMVFWEGVTKS
jgi:peptide/nickel transport system substrate-binding protein